MKTTTLLVPLLLALNLSPTQGQQPAPSGVGMPRGAAPAEESKLTKFSLDFPGGTPQELVNAIQKAMGKPLNVIIPDEHAQVKLPPLKLNNVNVQELFQALVQATLKSETFSQPHIPGYPFQSSTFQSSCSFSTDGPVVSDDSIWYFRFPKAPRPPVAEPMRICRFYSLSPYLERGLTVDDITTAIQTGWKMLGDENASTINYHKDTKLLIAVGDQSKLATIDDVLKALTPPPPPVEKKPEPKPAERKAE